MAEFKSLAEDIHCLETNYIRNEFAAFYLMREAGEVAIIETGTLHSLENLMQTLAQLDIDPSQVKYVIPTHVHLDHAGGAGHMMERFTQAELIIHPRGARHMIDPQKLIEGSIGVYGEAKFHQLYGEIKPVDEARVVIANDLDCHYLGNRELLFLDTPGHARHHFCIYDQKSNGIFSGDTFGSAYPALKQIKRGLIPTTTPVHFDPIALPASIDRLLSYQPQWMYLTHYGELAEPAKHAASLKQWIEQYVALCEQIAPNDTESEQVLEDALRELMLDEFSAELDRKFVNQLLDVDIKLNVQGIAHWWRTTHRL